MTAERTPAVALDVVELARAATIADAAAPLSEEPLLRLRADAEAGPLDRDVHRVVQDADGTLVGYAQLAHHSAELVVHPDHRHQGNGTALVRDLLASDPDVRIWSHSGHPDAAGIAASAGLVVTRELWEMARGLGENEPLPEIPPAPPGITVRTFVPGRDDDAWVALNATVFADHPEQGRITVDDLHARMGEPWFDAAGFYVATSDDDRLVAYHWTKVHDDDPPVGEVYVVGVDPDRQGLGLGRLMTLVGLHHLRNRGLAMVTLFVDESNRAAVATYSALGFVRTAAHVQFGRPS